MITPRRTTLFRVPDLAAFRTTIADWILSLMADQAGETFVLVPTRGAADELRRTVEDHGLGADRQALAWPAVGPRRDFYEEISARLPASPDLLSGFEREVILSAVARAVAAKGLEAPFQMRPGLVAEMLALYDQVRRLGRSVEDFERNFHNELEREQETDRGAARLLQQTRFLAAVYRGYEDRLRVAARFDEHALRELILGSVFARPLRRVVVTVADRLADPDGLWPADLDLLTRLPDLERLDLVCTEAVLAAGYLERLYAALPDLEEVRPPHTVRRAPRLVTYAAAEPGGVESIVLTHRDREEELAAVARRLKVERRDSSCAPLHRTALVVRQPLPYLYLARDVFADAAIPFETLDTLPLAAEPYAAAVDLALEAVAGDLTRPSLLALLRSPHFALERDGGSLETPAWNAAIAACELALAEVRYLGGLDRLQTLVAQWNDMGAPASRDQRRRQTALPAARAALAAVEALRPLADERPMIAQIATLVEWLHQFDRPATESDPLRSRRSRVRAAVLGALAALGHAYERQDSSARGDVHVLTAAIRRWLGAQTFATNVGATGLHVVDAQAARYGDFDDVQIVGLIEGEWPERTRRNVLYPSSLMALLEPLPASADPARRDRDTRQSARAAFKDLVFSPASRIRLSTFALENDAVVEPSILLDDVAAFTLPTEHIEPQPARVSFAEALSLEPRRPEVVPAVAALWATARVVSEDRGADEFRGEAGAWRMPRVSVSRLERYLDCPFRFFASEVLQIEEQPDDEDTRTPLERGRFLHELWEQFFAEWQRRGHGRVEPERLREARAVFEELCERALAELPPAEAVLERSRLLGSPLNPGIAHRVFAMEAERLAEVTERLLEFPLQGDFTFRARTGQIRVVTLSAKVDRIDLLADGTLRVIDYKSRKTPDLKQALQLPIYSYCSRESLRASKGGAWTIAEALYLSFEGDRAVISLRAKGRTTDELLEDAQDRLLAALDDIAGGHFPPRPSRKSLCGPCPYRAVCRLEIVEQTPEAIGD